MLRSSLYNRSYKARSMKDRLIRLKDAKASARDGLYVLTCLLITVSFLSCFEVKIQLHGTEPVLAKQIVEVPVVKETVKFAKAPDERVTKLETFLNSKNSPLAEYAELIVSEADRNDIGWTWITGISCMESACGLRLPQGSYNAWGLGGSRFMYFSSWEESIKYMSQLIGTNYRQNILQGIKQNYCPASNKCNPAWSAIVAKASTDILTIEQ